MPRACPGDGKLNETQALLFRDERPAEELYAVNVDPHEINNLADNPKYAEKLEEMRGMLDAWMRETGDLGQRPEPARMFESDMAVYLGAMKSKKRPPEHRKAIEDNIALMKRWAAEGK